MEKKKPPAKAKPQAQLETQISKLEAELGMTHKQALDIMLEKASKGKKQIAQGKFVTLEESVQRISTILATYAEVEKRKK
ncbi:MAG: hypothetical protein FWC00_01960 [Firmicutes bacterium]|nr:hypothetical protein [Bacillota bacterium]